METETIYIKQYKALSKEAKDRIKGFLKEALFILDNVELEEDVYNQVPTYKLFYVYRIISFVGLCELFPVLAKVLDEHKQISDFTLSLLKEQATHKLDPSAPEGHRYQYWWPHGGEEFLIYRRRVIERLLFRLDEIDEKVLG